MRRVGILTVSDRGAAGEYEDRSGPLAADLVTAATNWTIDRRHIVADEQETIAETLRLWSDEGLDLILTSGGTGFAPRDVTPEATRQIIDREAPGLVEAMRADSLRITRHGMLSRAVAGLRGRTLIINLPGNPKAVRENLDLLLPVLPHALDLVTGSPEGESRHRAI